MFGVLGSKLNNRIVIPVYMGGKLVYYQSRSIDGKQPKYLGAISEDTNKKVHTIFNFDLALLNKKVIVCEGALNAIIAGESAIALLGKTCSEEQFLMLIAHWEKFVIAFDKDAYKYSMKLAKRLMSHGKQVKIVSFKDDKDISDIGKTAFNSLVDKSSYGIYDYLKFGIKESLGV